MRKGGRYGGQGQTEKKGRKESKKGRKGRKERREGGRILTPFNTNLKLKLALCCNLLTDWRTTNEKIVLTTTKNFLMFILNPVAFIILLNITKLIYF
jgi:hypothetical protein